MAEFIRPDWLGLEPFSSFAEYGDYRGRTWLNLDSKPNQSLYDTHMDALKGDPRALEIIRLYYLALTTARLKP